MSLSRVPNFLRSRPALIAAVAAACAVPVSSASAAGVVLKITDPAGDSTGGSSLEITGATITQDTTKGSVTAVVTFAAAPKADATLAIGLGKLSGGQCNLDDTGNQTNFVFFGAPQPPTGAWVVSGDTASHPVTPTISGTTFTIASGSAAVLKKFSWNCANVAIQAAQEDGNPIGDTATGSGPGAGAAQVVVLTDKPDGDKDGVPDVADACPTVAGSSANGCLSIAANLALRLGAKRVAIDMMVPRTGASCGATAKATVKDGSKSIGKGTLDVGVHGSFCHISGAIKTKKHGKKVKIKIAGTGFKAVSATVKK